MPFPKLYKVELTAVGNTFLSMMLASLGFRCIFRYTQNNGHYEMTQST